MWYLIALAIVIGLIVYFWATIWMIIKIILGIAGIVMLVISILVLFSDDNDDDENERVTPILIGIGGLALTIFFIIVPYWSICKWILLGIGIIVGVILLSTYISEQNKKRKQEFIERAIKRVQSNLEETFEGSFLPIPEKLDKTYNILNLNYFLGEYKKLSEIIEGSNGADREIYKKQLFDKQLILFYELNIYPESKISEYVEDYFQRSKDLRKDIYEQNILQRNPKELGLIQTLKTKLSRIKVPNVDSRIRQIESMDITNNMGFTSIDKLTSQTQQYQSFSNELIGIVEELDLIRGDVNNELTKVRLVAHRNIYLAREVVNFYLSKGKNNEEMEKSLFNIDISQLESSSLNIDQLTMDYGNALADGALAGMGIVNSLRGSGVRVGNKAAAGVAIAGAALNIWSEREQKKEANREQQRKLVKNIEKTADAIQEEKTAIKSTLELIEKIVKTNIDLYCAYVPLRDKVFSGNSELTKNDFLPLIKLVGAFNDIRNDKLIN
ncbi:MAG: hypothetical protein U0L65_08020 [Bacteroidales bacterium]|nr:hypothetical protein [Bacteroidales bacterium]